LARMKNLYPNQEGANETVRAGHSEVLEWLTQHDIYPDRRSANLAAMGGQMGMLKWLAQHNIYPDINGLNAVATYSHRVDILQWLAQQDGRHYGLNDISPKKYIIDVVLRNKARGKEFNEEVRRSLI